jgi:hypothetical protein
LAWYSTAFAAVRKGAATLTDTLALVGERMPGVTSLTVTAAGVTVTVVPKAPASPPAHTCPTCGRAHP